MFLTNFFDNLGWTRDDLKWICGLFAAIVVALATLSDTAAAALAVPAGALPYIRLGAFIVGIVSANYKTSGLPGRAWLLPLFLVTSLGMMASGCASQQAAIAKAMTQATIVSEQVHCGVATAPVPPLCLTDAQFRQVNLALMKVSQAQIDYIDIVKQAQAAKTQPPMSAAVAFIGVLSNAMADISQITGASTDQILAALKQIPSKL